MIWLGDVDSVAWSPRTIERDTNSWERERETDRQRAEFMKERESWLKREWERGPSEKREWDLSFRERERERERRLCLVSCFSKYLQQCHSILLLKN